jgi:hypothetical protein
VATIEQRIEHLFSGEKHSKTALIATIASIFAEQRNDWLTHKDIINLMNKRFADSTVKKAFKELSRPLDALDGHGFIDIESDKKNSIGSPIKRGRLSDAACARLFPLVTPVNQKPPSKFIMSGEDLIEIPPPKVGDKFLSPEELIRLRKQKSGKTETRRILRKLAHDDQGSEKEAIGKVIEKMAEQQGMLFNVTLGRFFKNGRVVKPNGKLAVAHFKWTRLHGNKECYAVDEGKAGIFASHRQVGAGKYPEKSHRRYTITEEGIKKELAPDENRIAYSSDTIIEKKGVSAYLMDAVIADVNGKLPPCPEVEDLTSPPGVFSAYNLPQYTRRTMAHR